MFRDLPRIDLQEIDYRSGHNPAEEPDLWPSFPSQDPAMRFHPSGELEFSAQSIPLVPGMQRYPSQEQSASFNSFSWMSGLPRARSHPMPSQCEGLNPIPYNLAIPRDTSPDGWWSGDRPALEPDCSSGVSTWSPRTSEGRPEIDAGGLRQWGELHAASAAFYPGPSVFPKSAAYQGPGPDSGIALREIQQYPDVESEELSVKQSQDVKNENPYYVDSGGFHRSVESHFQEDEGIGSSIQEDDDGVAMEEEDDASQSEYIPTETKRGHRRNISSSTAASSRAPMVASPTPKRPSRPRIPSSASLKSNSKVTKRSHTKPLAPTPSPTSPTAPQKSGKTKCDQCAQSFQSASALHKHTLASHTRPFACSFHLYGCSSTFGSKNEWKRHVSSQHLRLGIYRCDIGQCIPQPKPHQHRRKSSSSTGTYTDALEAAAAAVSPTRNGAHAKDATGHNDFNRKDLFTQHVRRMHGPPTSAPQVERDTFDASLEGIRTRCWIPLREPPPRSCCGFCPAVADPSANLAAATEGQAMVFDGAWEERMEHVGKHLEKGVDVRLEREDLALRDWMLSQKLVSRDGAGLKVVGCGTRRRGKGAVDDGEEDGEGDEEWDFFGGTGVTRFISQLGFFISLNVFFLGGGFCFFSLGNWRNFFIRGANALYMLYGWSYGWEGFLVFWLFF